VRDGIGNDSVDASVRSGPAARTELPQGRVVVEQSEAAPSSMADRDEKCRCAPCHGAEYRRYSPGREREPADTRANEKSAEDETGPQVVSKLTSFTAGDGNFDNVFSPPASFDRIAQPVRVPIGIGDKRLCIHTSGVGGRAALPADPVIGFLCHGPLAQPAPSRFRRGRGLVAKSGNEQGVPPESARAHCAR
jgi:hypothetical protein